MAYPFTPSEKWDVHTHTTLSPKTYDQLARFSHYQDFVRVKAQTGGQCSACLVDSDGKTLRQIEDNAFTAPTRLRDCDKHGVTTQVISPTPMMIPDGIGNVADAAEICKILNDDNAAIAAHAPKRFVALGALPMNDADLAIAELTRIKHDLRMAGVEILSNIGGRDLDDPAFFPVFEAAADMGMAVFVHPWGGFMSPVDTRLQPRMNPNRNWRPWLMGMGLETALAFDAMRSGGVHERLPNLRVLYAHGGGVFPPLLGRMEHGAYCRPDLFEDASNQTPYQAVRDCQIFTDTLTHNPWVLMSLIQTLGTHRVAMGSDYPYPLGEIDPFDAATNLDARGMPCPYDRPKGIYPGHMVEHLPQTAGDQAAAWAHFPWMQPDNTDGVRDLPYLTSAQKQQILSETAKDWLGV